MGFTVSEVKKNVNLEIIATILFYMCICGIVYITVMVLILIRLLIRKTQTVQEIQTQCAERTQQQSQWIILNYNYRNKDVICKWF